MRNRSRLSWARSCSCERCPSFQQRKLRRPERKAGAARMNCGEPVAGGFTRPGLRYIGRMTRIVAIVEDDPAIRANYADLLKKHGYQVSAFPDRGSAIAAFRSRLPDLALLDIGLGGEPDGGFALCRELRVLSAALPIISLTPPPNGFLLCFCCFFFGGVGSLT